MAKPQKKAKHYLTPAQKTEAVRLFRSGRFTRAELAEKFDISPTTLGKLIKAAPATALPANESGRVALLVELGGQIARVIDKASAAGYEFKFELFPKE